MTDSREIKLCFWVRQADWCLSQGTAPSRWSSRFQMYSDTLGQPVGDPRKPRPEHSSQHTLLTYFFHIFATTFSKDILFLPFQSSCCHKEAEKSTTESWQMQAGPILYCVRNPNTDDTGQFRLTIDTQKTTSPQLRPFASSDASQQHTKCRHGPKYTPCTVCIE